MSKLRSSDCLVSKLDARFPPPNKGYYFKRQWSLTARTTTDSSPHWSRSMESCTSASGCMFIWYTCISSITRKHLPCRQELHDAIYSICTRLFLFLSGYIKNNNI
ncbi:uncharacterized protein ASPGLDRAFT_1488450 [Aspergillus glaucus CBS 516.65]|uniref:Uncharacterized protein n=1 Tax=Aspergillus glaucus CBS 516.65 TaxID=1160497 RepID=A0A1L9VLV6_ASPGL|nr:hypothetical protein ASPGLDRAFT_1488450 [Aspergillus glaucus CBS 516.65]OJJ84918.1 hypothetical protein ASPGLDRAFT_1488450 [Aspergillus glaucus CBS 516.65]